MASSGRSYFTVVPSGYIFFRNGDSVLLSRRKNTGYHDGEYSLPAGHIEDREYVIAGTVREAKEEAGVDVKPEDVKLVHVMYRMCSDHVRADYFFEVTKWEGEISNPEPEKCADLTWYKLSELPDDIIPYIKSALDHYVKGEMYSEFDETTGEGNRIRK
ncbi:MAG: NUDIX domain-containing protein [Candidatus Andersenbacteria bacterium]